MPRTKSAVTQSEIARCLKAARDAGYEDCRVEYEKPDGTRVRIVAGKTSDDDAQTDEFDDLIGRLPDATP